MKTAASSKASSSQLSQKKDKGIFNNPNYSNTIASNHHKCFNCLGFGHIAVDCSNRKFIFFHGRRIVHQRRVRRSINQIGQGRFNEKELVYANQGEALVVHCNLNTTMVVDEEDGLCHNIFHANTPRMAKCAMPS